MEEQERDDILNLLVQAVVRANHVLMACELAKDEDSINGLVIPLAQAETLGKMLGSVAMAFTKTGLFTQEEIEQQVVEQTKIQDVMNLTMQLVSQGADDEIIKVLLSSMGYEDQGMQHLINQARKLYAHLQEEHPEMLPLEFEHPFKKFVAAISVAPNNTKH